MKKRIFSLLLACAMLFSCAASAETVKHEHLFAVTGADGTVQTLIDSVHLENGDGLDEIADQTALENIQNVSGHETFDLSGESLTWQAKGSDITYQGNGTAQLPVAPAVSFSLDGQTISAAELAGKSGKLTVTVSYELAGTAPVMAVSALLLDEEHFSNIVCENAALVSDGSRNLLLGWAVPGMPEALGLPEQFSFTCDCTGADLSLMYTGATSAPLKALTEKADGKVADGRTLSGLLTGCLTALNDGSEMPQGDAEIVDIFTALASLKNGAATLSGGAGELESGLATLTENNDALNQGAQQLFAAVLQTANAQLAASGLAEAGINVPELTAEGYGATMEAVLEQLDPDTLRKTAEEGARDTVTAQVMKQEKAIRAAVNEAVQAKVLEGVLGALGLNMDAETYAGAVKAGQVSSEQNAQITAAVEQQMAGDEVKAQAEAAFQQQVAQLVEQNLQGDAVQAKITEAIAPAQAAYEQLSGLKAQLDSVNTFVNGLSAYTAGVSTAREGAAQLSQGSQTLAQGISQGLQTISDKLLPLLTGDTAEALDAWDEMKTSLSGADRYDLVAEGMDHDLMIVIRSELSK